MRATPFDHHHGLLQHHEFDAGRHVEQGRDLEQKRQQLRHRDLVGAPVVDRLADGADRLREILDRMMRRHVAGLEMHLRDAQVIAADEAEQNLGEEPPLLHAEAAHDAEIDRHEPALIVHEQVAGMHVGVKEAVADGVAQEGLDDRAPERRPVEARGLDGREIVEADAVDPGGGQHVAGGQIPFGLRHAGNPDRPWCSPPAPRRRRPRGANPSRPRPNGPASPRFRPA